MNTGSLRGYWTLLAGCALLFTVSAPVAAEDGGSVMVRCLDGTDWQLAMDHGNVGREQGWFNGPVDGAKPTKVPWIIQDAFPGCHGVAWYWRSFDAPANPFKEGRYVLRFWAVDYAATVWVNGKPVGAHEGGESPFELDVTDAIRPGADNLLAVRVLNPIDEPIDGIVLKETPHRDKVVSYWAGASFDQGGIMDSVELIVTPCIRITDVFAQPDAQTGRIRIQVCVHNARIENIGARIDLAVAPAASGGTLDTAALDRNFAPGDTWIDETLAIDEPRRWELNDPFLYRVSVRVSMDNSGAFDEQSVRCGFRDFRFENGYFRLNGKRLFLRCSHTGNHCPLGLQLPHDPDLLRRDLLNVKVMGFNAIRFIAGVGTRYQLDLCDEIGLLVYEEPYAGWCMENSPKMAERFDESVFGMVRRDRNHPSIVMWGLLNETNDGPVFRHAADMLDDVRALDDTRMVMLNSGRWDGLADPPTLGLSLWHTEDRPDPNVSYNGTDVPITGYGVTWKPGRMALHPGPKCEFSVVRWTAPSAGRCDIAAAFEGLAEKATTDVYVLHNGAPLLEGVLNLAGNGNRAEYAGAVPVATGDRIDFVVGAGNGDYGGDTTALEATVALDSGAPADAAASFSLAGNPNGAWSYGSLPQSQKPGASQFVLYAKGEQIDDAGALGSLSNPGSRVWENVLNDQHCYPRVPHTAAVMRSLREYRGGGHGAGMGEEGYPPSPPAGANRKPVFLSEYGIGSAVDLVRVTRHYERLGAEYLEDAQFYRAQLDRFLQDWDRWAMADTFGRPEDYFAQCVAKMAGQRLLGLDAIRSNPDFVGYSLTGTVDQGMTGEGLTTTFREFKPGTFDAMSEGLAPLRWCLFAEPLNVYRGATVHLDAVLANEDALRPGSYTARFQVFGPNEALVLERTAQVDIPETETGHEPPLAIPVLLEDVVLDGPAGAYRFTAAFEQGAVAQGGETTFFVDDPATMPAAGAEIALCGEDAGLVEWLAKNGISARAFEAGRSVPGEVILVCGPVTPEASKALAQHVQAGATAIFLRPAGIEALVPGIEVKDIRGWLYLKDEWTKRHPIFNGLPAGGLMDYAFYRELIPDTVWTGGPPPESVVAGAIKTSQGYDSGLLVAVYKVGEGHVVLNTLRIREYLGTHPAAERLLRNMLRCEWRETGLPN